MRKLVFTVVASGLLTASGIAAAQYPPPPPPPGGGYGYGGAPPPPAPMGGAGGQHFADQGQLVISNDANVGFSGTSYSNNGGSTWTFTLQPALDYFVIPNLSIGGEVIFTHSEVSSGGQNSQTASSNAYGVGGRVGYNIGLGDSLSFWPKLALLYVGSSTNPPGGGQGTSGSAFDVQVYAPFLLHPVKHFFFGLGPFIQTDLTASQSLAGVNNPNPTKATSYGLLFDLGGWMDF